MTLNSTSFRDNKLDSINTGFLQREDAESVEYARIVLQGLVSIYKQASVTGDTVLNLVLGRAHFMRNFALSLVMTHDVYNEIVRRGYTVHFWYDMPEHTLEGLSMIMQQPNGDDRELIMQKMDEEEFYAKRAI